MSDTAFLLGRLLALADTLHKEYCRRFRKGDVPLQLLGNALIPVAAANPEERSRASCSESAFTRDGQTRWRARSTA